MICNMIDMIEIQVHNITVVLVDDSYGEYVHEIVCVCVCVCCVCLVMGVKMKQCLVLL